MDKKQYTLTVVLSMLTGLLGGVVSSWLFVGTPVFAQKTPQVVEVVRAEEFELVNKKGEIRASLGLDTNGEPRLALYNNNLKPGATLALVNGEPRLTLVDNNLQTRAELGLVNGEPWLRFADKNGKPRAGLWLVNGEPGLDFYDNNLQPRAGLGLVNGEPSLRLADKNGKVMWGAP